MFHTCIARFDVMGTIAFFWENFSNKGRSELATAVLYCAYQQGVGLTGTDCAWLVAAGLYLLGKAKERLPRLPLV